MGEDQDKVLAVISEFLRRAQKGGDGFAGDTSLWGDGLGLDSLEAAELSAMLEDEFTRDPFSTGEDMPETVNDILAFYE